MFEVLDHTADIGLRARGATREEMYAVAALALQHIALDASEARPAQEFEISAEGPDEESLLVNFLSEALYLIDGRRIAIARLAVERLSETQASARLWGEPRDPARHPPKLVVKGVTYHQLRVRQNADGWTAEVYLDI